VLFKLLVDVGYGFLKGHGDGYNDISICVYIDVNVQLSLKTNQGKIRRKEVSYDETRSR